MIKLEEDNLSKVTEYLRNREIIVLTPPFDDIVDCFKSGSQYWVYRYVGCCYPLKYDMFWRDKTKQKSGWDICKIADSVVGNVLEGHNAYVVTEVELNSLKILNELIN